MTTFIPTSSAPPIPARKKAGPLNMDWGLLLIVAMLIAYGLIMVYSTTFDWSYRQYDSPTTIFFRQVTWLALGVAAMLFVARLDYHIWIKLAVPLLAFTVFFLIVVLIFGTQVFGAQRGLFQGSLQPSELAKLVTVVYLAVWLTSKGEKINDISYGLVPFGVMVGFLAGLVLRQPDISAALTIIVVGAAMFFLAGADVLQISLASVTGGAIGYLIVITSATARARLSTWLAGLTNITETSWHVQQAVIAFINGGFFGRGIGESRQKFQALPTPHTDSIFAVVGEELGLIGCVFLIALFILLIWRGAKIAANARDSLGAIIASGITVWFAFEAIINIGVMVAAVPFAGNALPFISYGGSSLVVSLCAIGLLLSISRQDPDSSIQRKTRASFDYSRRDRRPRLSRADRRS
ncbi:MAG: cell division protein FtsW [Chloroflexi bacterium]|nr:cell division protein FtsW [Chloroflexota bacterium]MBI5053577.1 cell division protein FtsW [Chloroflexota bacterium]